MPAIVAAFRFNRLDRDAVFTFWLYGPLMFIESLGLAPECSNANSVSEKLSCIRFGLMLDLVVYPLVICGLSLMVYFILFRRQRRAD